MNDGVITREVRGEEKEYELTDKEKNLVALIGAAKVLYILGAPAELGRVSDQINKILEEKFTEPAIKFKPMTKKQKKEAGIIE
jgi:hypothetical protein